MVKKSNNPACCLTFFGYLSTRAMASAGAWCVRFQGRVHPRPPWSAIPFAEQTAYARAGLSLFSGLKVSDSRKLSGRSIRTSEDRNFDCISINSMYHAQFPIDRIPDPQKITKKNPQPKPRISISFLSINSRTFP